MFLTVKNKRTGFRGYGQQISRTPKNLHPKKRNTKNNKRYNELTFNERMFGNFDQYIIKEK